MRKNSRVFVTGDLHATGNIPKFAKKNFPEGQNLCKKDVVIIAGDFGLLWSYKRTKQEAYWLAWLDDQPWTTCFVDGNHENFDLLDNLQKRELYGSEVGIVCHSVFHLLRGRVYNIGGKRILTIGGAFSVDRHWRKWGETMWEQEEITQVDIALAFSNLINYQNKVDYVVTHCAPFSISNILRKDLGYATKNDISEELLEEIKKQIIFKKWFFGHYHSEKYDTYGYKWHCVYDNFIELF